MQIQHVIQGQGKPIVLFHGWGFDSSIWLPIMGQLTSNFEVHLIDLPGFGNTSLMDSQSFENALLNILPSSFALLGWSLGGLYATRFALEFPERVTHLLNIGSSPRFQEDLNWPGLKPEKLEQFFEALLMDPQQTLNQFIRLQAPEMLNGAPLKMPTLSALQNGLKILQDWDLRKALNQIKMPTCYLLGRLDAILPISLMSAMQTQYPQFKYIIFKKAAHSPFLSHPLDFMKTISEFIV